MLKSQYVKFGMIKIPSFRIRNDRLKFRLEKFK